MSFRRVQVKLLGRLGKSWFLNKVLQKMNVPDVIPIGLVDDLGPHFAAARVLVAPVLNSTGVATKVMRGVELCLPVVTTLAGAQGTCASTSFNSFHCANLKILIVQLNIWVVVVEEQVCHKKKKETAKLID